MATAPQQIVSTQAALDASQLRRPYGYPANSLVGVVDSTLALLRLRATLTDLGVAPERIETLRCAADCQRLMPPTGLRRAARHWLGSLGPEAELFERHTRELRARHTLVIVHGVRRADADPRRDLLAASGGHAMQHFGRLTVALLTP